MVYLLYLETAWEVKELLKVRPKSPTVLEYFRDKVLLEEKSLFQTHGPSKHLPNLKVAWGKSLKVRINLSQLIE